MRVCSLDACMLIGKREKDMTKQDKDLSPIEFIEKHYPQTAREFKEIQDEMYQMFAAKHMDYGLQNISLGGDLTKENDKNLMDKKPTEINQ